MATNKVEATKAEVAKVEAPAMFATAAKRFHAIAGKAKELRGVLAEANRAVEANGFEANLAATEYLTIDMSDLADWNPGSDNDAERAIRDLHYMTAPESSPKGLRIFSDALFWAVCAMPEEHWRAARNGGANVSDDDAEFKKLIPARLISTTGAKPRHFSGTSADALAALNKGLADTKDDKATAAVFQQALAAHAAALKGEYNLIRRMGADKNVRAVRANRWRRVLYLNVCKPALQAYADRDPVLAVGKVWSDLCGAVQTTHKKYWASLGENAAPNQADLAKLITEEINSILGKKAEPQSAAKAETDPADDLKKAISRVLSAANAVDELLADKNSQLWVRTEAYLSGLGVETTTKAKSKKAAPAADGEVIAPPAKAPAATTPVPNATAPRKRAPSAPPAATSTVTSKSADDAMARMKAEAGVK